MWIDDQILRRCQANIASSVWRPDKTIVVLGSSNKVESEVVHQNCIQDGVAVLRRYGGGGTVVLYPGCVIVSLGVWVKRQFYNDLYFRLLNQAVIEVLKKRVDGGVDLSQNGISDIVSCDRKFCGTSMFRSRNYLLYQASIICDLDLSLVDRYLQHPSKEPEYRANRSHKDFLVGLLDLHPELTTDVVCDVMSSSLTDEVQNSLGEEYCSVAEEQVSCLIDRVNRAD